MVPNNFASAIGGLSANYRPTPPRLESTHNDTGIPMQLSVRRYNAIENRALDDLPSASPPGSSFGERMFLVKRSGADPLH